MSLKALRRRKVRIANSRWTAYAVAGAATSLATLATAEAEIHYSGPVNFRFKGTLTHSFPLADGAVLFFAHNDLGSGNGHAHLAIGGALSSYFAGDKTQNVSSATFYFYRLGSQVNVSQQPLGHSCRRVSATYGSYTTTYCYGGFIGRFGGGHFTEPGRGFIGFEFQTLAGYHNGWVRVKTSGAGAYNFIVLDYAWGDPGEPIETGQKQSQVNKQAVTKPGSLGLLATGATGLKAWRQQRGVGTP
jgi:hypothetical protein